MSKVRIELDTSAIDKFLKSAEMNDFISQYASQIAQRAGSGYAFSTHNTGQRVAANIYAQTAKARRDNQKNNTLLKVMR